MAFARGGQRPTVRPLEPDFATLKEMAATRELISFLLRLPRLVRPGGDVLPLRPALS